MPALEKVTEVANWTILAKLQPWTNTNLLIVWLNYFLCTHNLKDLSCDMLVLNNIKKNFIQNMQKSPCVGNIMDESPV
jgi:hypothetical protein